MVLSVDLIPCRPFDCMHEPLFKAIGLFRMRREEQYAPITKLTSDDRRRVDHGLRIGITLANAGSEPRQHLRLRAITNRLADPHQRPLPEFDVQICPVVRAKHLMPFLGQLDLQTGLPTPPMLTIKAIQGKKFQTPTVIVKCKIRSGTDADIGPTFTYE